MKYVVLTVCLLAMPVCVAAQTAPELPNALFGLQPGRTTRAVALQQLGESDLEWVTFVFSDELQPFLSMHSPDELGRHARQAKQRGATLELVDVLEFKLDKTRPAQLVFRNDLLWYVVVPADNALATTEAVVEGVEDLSGSTREACSDAFTVKTSRRVVDVVIATTYTIHPDEGVVVVHSRGRYISNVFFEPGTDSGLRRLDVGATEKDASGEVHGTDKRGSDVRSGTE